MNKKFFFIFLLFVSIEQKALLTSDKNPERKLMSWKTTEINNRAYEIGEFRKQVGKFLSVLKDK